MSLFADFVGGAATSLKQAIDTSMLEDIRAKAEEKKMALANKFSKGEIMLSNILAGKREHAQASSIEARTKMEQDAMNQRNKADLEFRGRQEIEKTKAANMRNAETTAATRYRADRSVDAATIRAQRKAKEKEETPLWMRLIGGDSKNPFK